MSSRPRANACANDARQRNDGERRNDCNHTYPLGPLSPSRTSAGSKLPAARSSVADLDDCDRQHSSTRTARSQRTTRNRAAASDGGENDVQQYFAENSPSKTFETLLVYAEKQSCAKPLKFLVTLSFSPALVATKPTASCYATRVMSIIRNVTREIRGIIAAATQIPNAVTRLNHARRCASRSRGLVIGESARYRPAIISRHAPRETASSGAFVASQDGK